MNLLQAVEQRLADNAVRPAEVAVTFPTLGATVLVRKIPKRQVEKALYHYRDSQDIEVDLIAGILRWALIDPETGQPALRSYDDVEKLLDVLSDEESDLLRDAMKQLGQVGEQGGVEAGKAS